MSVPADTPQEIAQAGPSEPARPFWRDATIILVVCIAVYWLFLGSTPFAASEGHRVAPGWTMLESGDWSRTEMFGLNYVRKPPGMPWAIAASSWLLGQNEWGARAPSALACTLMSLLAFAFARSWCGPKAGLAAGLAQALLPLMWTGGGGGAGGPGRSAEIEALNTFCTQLAAFPLISLLLSVGVSTHPPTARRIAASAALTGIAALGIVGLALTKGPASAPCIGGAIIGVCIARRTSRPLFSPSSWAALLIGGTLAYFTLRHFAAINSDPDAVRETGSFLWQHPAKVLTVIPMALLATLPMSLALLVPFGADARGEGESPDAVWSRCVLAARACAFAFATSCLLYALSGVGNPRYLMPASIFLAPIVGYVIRGLAGGGSGPFARPGFANDRRTFLKRLLIRGPAAWAGVLAGGAFVINAATAMRSDQPSGRSAGQTIADALPSGATVWTDDLIEARPDILLYAQHAARETGRELDIRWAKPQMHRAKLPPITDTGSFLLLRTDDGSGEGTRYLDAMEHNRLRLVGGDQLGKYVFALFRVTPPAE